MAMRFVKPEGVGGFVSPQVTRFPSALIAMPCPPAAMATTLDKPFGTGSGLSRAPGVAGQDTRVPSVRSARLNVVVRPGGGSTRLMTSPQAIAITFDKVGGTYIASENPQATTLPSPFNARLRSDPAAMATTFESPIGTLVNAE